MITFVEGTLEEKQPTRAVISVGGIGYEVFIPLGSFEKLPGEGSSCRLLTYDYVRDDQHSLYGFVTPEERRMFLLLMTVSGIGPKLALGTLSGMTVKELKASIVSGDARRLASIPGVGKKTSERIIVDLKDKITACEAAEALAGDGLQNERPEMRDAVLALVSLGYKQADALKMTQKVLSVKSPPTKVEEIVRKALAQ